MKILISNDDGVQAIGLRILADSLRSIGEVVVVAPDRNRSGASNSLTLQNPLRVQQLENGFYSVEGTPTDCVHLAVTSLLSSPPNVVVAGINAGENLGDDVFYSGTVAAAMEGRFMGFPAIAVSLGGEQQHYETAATVVKTLVTCLQTHPLPAKTILNINVPDVPIDQLKGFDITRLGTRHRSEKTIEAMDPRGHKIYWVGLPGTEQDAGPGTDFYALNAKRVSVTPLQLDLTNYQMFESMATWIKKLEV